jgi:hypothetical protein
MEQCVGTAHFVAGISWRAQLLAAGAHFALNSVQESTAAANTTGSARLDQQETVNAIGREG